MSRLAVPVATLSLLLIACSDSGTEPAPEPDRPAAAALAPAPAPAVPFRVLDTFDVGADVYVRSLHVDSVRQTLWVGTSLGVLEVDLETFEPRNTFTRDNGLANEYVFATLADSEGGAWFGTNGGGVSRYRNGEWRTWFPMHGLADYWVYALAEEAPGTVWIGTWDGANRLDTATGEMVTFHEELVNEWVYGIGIDSQRRVWFGTEGGVSMFDGSDWREWTHADGLGAPNDDALPPGTNTGLGTRTRHDLGIQRDGKDTYNPNYVFSVLLTRDDSVWAGTWGGGASHFDGEAWHNLTRDDGLAGDVVFAIVEDEDGVLWFGTDQGLSRYDGENWTSFSTTDGLLGNAVYALAATGGEIWTGTRRGVTRLGAP